MSIERDECVFLAHKLFAGEISGKELVEEIKRRENIQLPLFTVLSFHG